MDVSTQMLEAVAHAKKQAKSAEQQFDFAADMVNIKSSSGIDLFGGRAVSQVADIASSVRKACDELYASYQSLVLMLDQQCRPLLSQNPSTHAVKEVMEMIKWLNKESEIGSNFSGSLNGSSLGDLVNVKYFASMECQMIQKHWENIYSTMPGTAEEDRAFSQRQIDARIAAMKAEREARIAAQEWERQRPERERKERAEALRQRLERNEIHEEETAACRKYLEPARNLIGNSECAIAFVKPNGTVDAFHKFPYTGGTPGNVSGFSNIQSVVCTNDGIVGLRNDGTCIATNPGRNCISHLQEVNQWSDIQALAAGAHHVVGLRSDGTCVITSVKWTSDSGSHAYFNVSSWRDIIAIACGDYFTIGLKSNGTIVYNGDADAEAAKNWTSITLIAAGGSGAVGVTKTGKVVKAGKVEISAIEIAENIVQVGVARGLAYALQSDGKVFGGSYIKDSRPTPLTSDAVAIAADDDVLVLRKDGYIRRFGLPRGCLHFPGGYRLFESYDEFAKEKLADDERRSRRAQQQKGYRDADVCQHCGGKFKKSLFGCKCGSCGKKKDY